MNSMKKFLSAILTIAMVMSMIVLPVSAEETVETIAVGETKEISVDPSAELSLTFTVPEDGDYFLSCDQTSGLTWVFLELGEMDGGEIYPDSIAAGWKISAKAEGFRYSVRIANPGTEVVSGIVSLNKADEAEESVETITAGSFVVSVAEPNSNTSYWFTPEEDGDYLFYWDRNSFSYGIGFSEKESGDWVDCLNWKNAENTRRGVLCSMKAGTTYTLRVSTFDEGGVNFTAYVTKTVPYETITFAEPEPCYLGRWSTLELIGTPEFSCSEVTWTSSNPEVVKISTSDKVSATIKGIDIGTSTITATAANGASASCEVTVHSIVRPQLGETVQIEVPYQSFARVEFSPEEDGTYVFSYPSTYDMELECCGIMSDDVREAQPWSGSDGTLAGAAFDLEAGSTYAVWVRNNTHTPSVTLDLTVSKADDVAEDDAPETIAVGETKNFTLEKDQQEVFLFTPAGSGRYIAYYPVSSCFVDIYEGTQLDAAEQMYPDMWQDSAFKYQGHAFDVEAGETYLIRTVNNWSDAAIDCQLSLMKAENYELFQIDWNESGLVGEERTVSVNFSPENASEAVVWTSSDESVAQITNPKGTEATVKLVGPGTATVTATSASGKVATSTVTVFEETPIKLDETVDVVLEAGESAYYKFTPADSGRYIFVVEADHPVDIAAYAETVGSWISGDLWTSGDGTKIGYAFSMEAGVTYSLEMINTNGEACACAITLIRAVSYDSISFAQSAYSGYLGSFMTLTLSGSPAYADETVTWTSSDSDVVYIEYAAGSTADIILINAGTATVTATTESGLTATCTVTVKAPITLENNAQQQVTLGKDEAAVFSFTAPSAGSYILGITGGDGAYAVMDETTGDWPESTDWCYANGADCTEYAMTAGQTFLIAIYGGNEQPAAYTVCMGQPTAQVSGMKLSADAEITYRGTELYLETWFEPILSLGESVTWASDAPDVAEYFETVSAYGVSYHVIKANGAGTATLTATSASGYTASCTVTVLEPEKVSAGVVTGGEIAAWDYAVYSFIPQFSGAYRLSWSNSDTLSLMIWDEADTLQLTDWESETHTGYEMELVAGGEYMIAVMNEAEIPQSVSFCLEELQHVHELTLVEAKPATFTEEGCLAHYTCPCGKLFSDAAGTVEVTLEDLRIPVKERPEGVLVGDVNGDGAVGIADLMRLANHFAKKAEINKANADCNGDGTVTIADLMRLANYFAGKAQLGKTETDTGTETEPDEEETKNTVVQDANPSTGISWDGKSPIVYTYTDGTTGTTPQNGATYEVAPGITGVYVKHESTQDKDEAESDARYCRHCGKVMGNGSGGTCVRWMTAGDHTCPSCGGTVPGGTCHTCE